MYDGEEEQDWRRRYDLRNCADMRRILWKREKCDPDLSVEYYIKEWILRLVGMLGRVGHKFISAPCITRAKDSDDTLGVDELVQCSAIPWGQGGSRSALPWLFGRLVIHKTTAWGIGVAASCWGYQGDSLATLTSGIQTAGPSSKERVDIQPLLVDESEF